ncbi:EamA family transporter [Oceanisphaera profunda]|uniref:EamA family transporter n=1 Tax=Oceanisphaera profunda TaxID=1416627 RepID=A0A1Y0D290_9GAMM|nr:DMT family transporter [Oceanisphaera profunda]ART81641.1 EamA family transporter [Oceanisphaera profunda]
MNNHQKGLLLTALGVLVIAPDALILRLISLPPEQVLLWRGLLNMVGFLLIVVLRYKSQWWRAYLNCGRAGIGCALLFSLSTLGFVMGNHFTKAANVLVILASAPLIAALLSRFFLQESLPLRTWLAIGGCMAGISLIVLDDLGSGSWLGSAFALLAAFGLAGNLTLARSQPHIDMSPMLALSGIITAGLAFSWSGTISGTIVLPDAVNLGWLVLLCLILLPIGFTLIQQGPQYLPSAEVSLLLLLETVFGTLLVWLFFSEAPSAQGLWGAAIVLSALLLKSLLDKQKNKPLLSQR